MNKLTLILWLAALFVSCTEEERLINPDPIGSVVRDKTVVLTLQIPGVYLPVTYAYSEKDENEIRTVDVLSFRVDSSGKEYYGGHIPVQVPERDNGNRKTLECRLAPIDSRLLVLANVRHLFTREMQERLRADSLAGNATKEQLMQRFVFDMEKPFGEEGEAFPMYGESDVLPASATEAGEIRMTRALCRIDIVNSLGDDRMGIDSVYLLHTKSKGFVAPGFDREGAMLGRANVPGEARPNANLFGYRFVRNTGGLSEAMEREIYTTEDAQDTDTPTCIILKISERDHPPQFYRVDMLDRDGVLLPIVRNYRYRLNVVKITGKGYPDVEAAAAVPTPSLSSRVETNELGISAVVFNSQYKLGVSTTTIAFRADGSWEGQEANDTDFSLKVHTTYSGWSAAWEGEGEGKWLNFMEANRTITRLDFPASRLELNMKARPNLTGKTRRGRLRLTAGSLHLDIQVVQYNGAV
ncbi:MAG: hypothetical protein LBD89_04470 [Tannerellaceae bacterium]|jgi:hypothetical protein|nr:hypothetical protein [Tannerellaceae bacterium]